MSIDVLITQPRRSGVGAMLDTILKTREISQKKITAELLCSLPVVVVVVSVILRYSFNVAARSFRHSAAVIS